MARFDRYFLRQLLLAFGFSALVLVLVYWINRAVLLFDRLIANGESTRVFLELTLLTLPSMIAIVLPVAAFVATLVVTNRLTAENELIVAQSAGLSPARMARPVLYFGALTTAFMLALGHVLVPISQDRLAQRQAQISQNVSARFLTEGEFVHPAKGITAYVREITRNGELLDVFLSDRRDASFDYAYSARRALLVRSPEGPRLVMFDGLTQALRRETGQLSVTAFSDFTYNLSALSDGVFRNPRNYTHLTSAELLRATPALLAETGKTRQDFALEFHLRTARAVISIAAVMIAFSTLLLGGYSRFGLWRQIFGAVVLLSVLKILDNALVPLAARGPATLWLAYLASGLGTAIGFFLLWLAPRPGLVRRTIAAAHRSRPKGARA